jgi:hypothetical protein
MYEIEIARVFACSPQLRTFHPLFLSCNEAIDGTRWCNKCSKCCFIFLILSAWMPPNEVCAIFEDNLFGKMELASQQRVRVAVPAVSVDSESRTPIEKPFECVGTFEEARCAVELSMRRWREHTSNNLDPDTINSSLNNVVNKKDVVLLRMAEHLGIRLFEDKNYATDGEEDDDMIIKRWLPDSCAYFD